MFRKTRLQLTLLNSIVFIIILIFLGRAIYFYMESQVYKGANESLHLLMQRVSVTAAGSDVFHVNVPDNKDPSTYVLVWNQDNKLIEEFSEPSPFFVANQKKFYSSKRNKIEEFSVKNYTFRSLTTEVGPAKIQVVRLVTAEKKVLDRLVLILIIGGGIGILFAILAGFFLAGRALVPIQRAWDNQQQFVSDASHELRTPLSVIQSRTEMLFRSPSATIEEKAVDISIISKEARRLNKLVASLLTLAKSDTGRVAVNKENFSLDSLIREIIEQYSDIAAFQDKTIKEGKVEPVMFMGDKERIHQLIVILVDNALKYTEEGGEIELSCRKDSLSVVLSVKDNGIGIEAGNIPKIFNRFFQVDSSRTSQEGAGLGLSIAKWIADNHSGSFKVKSSPGKGTLIDVIFPKNQKKI
ncbi:sensor histidine kinase [Peribacillus kribbensis]|uniref:sensor histidine kinase n=1 Tax=Peribacillus kribbensis TaxID=356658 RepID=UPI00040321D3|nr:HAMP domain-containing sensor histidine kinase [Peribacillus kribbensis]